MFDNPGHCSAVIELLSSPQRGDGWVVGYSAMAGEVDLGAVYELQALGPFALTRTPGRSQGMDLSVHPLTSPSEPHSYGYQQPVADAPIVADSKIAVVLVPGLAFSRSGDRLGHGKGYYDRFLARLAPFRPLIVGVTGGYLVDDLPVDAHDVKMTHLVDARRVWAIDQVV